VANEVVALIGANGAGKSTLVRTVSGLHRCRAGSITWEGSDITREPAHKIVPLGIVQVPEGRHLFSNQSVFVNLRLGGYSQHISSSEERLRLDEIFRLFPRLYERRDQPSGTLSGGEQQMLAIGRALMARPRLLILDEPSTGLAPTMVKDIFAALQELRRQGMSILLVEQNARLALEFANRGYVMETGRVVMEGDAATLVREEHVRRAYLGAEVAMVSP